MILVLIKICRFLLWDFVTLSFNIDILFSIVLFSTLFNLFFKILGLCAESYLEPSQTSKGLIISTFKAWAKNFNLVKRVEKKKIIWSFSFQAEHFSPRAEFHRPFSLPVSQAVLQRCSREKVFLSILQNSQENTMSESLLNKVAGLRLAQNICLLKQANFVTDIKKKTRPKHKFVNR